MSKSFGEIARHPARFGVILALGLLALVVGIMNVGAVHNEGLLELDGNTEFDGGLGFNPGPAPGDNITTAATFDWENVCERGPSGAIQEIATQTFADVAACTADYGNPDTSYHRGSDKDFQNISAPGFPADVWGCVTAANPLNKNDILNAYAALVEDVDSGDTILYFGQERDSNNGTAFVGFWFLQDEVGVPSPCNSDPFTGVHEEGDVLILANYTSGGSIGSIGAYSWTDPDGDITTPGTCTTGPLAEATLCTVFTPGVGDCRLAAPADLLCGRINSGPAPVAGIFSTPWEPRDAASCPVQRRLPADCLDVNTFFEGGANLTEILALAGREVGCLGSFVSETRSSAATDATLKDFALGDFDTCKPDVTVAKTSSLGDCAPADDCRISAGESYTYTITVSNAGPGDATNVVVTDDLDDDLIVDSVTPSQGTCDAVGAGNTIRCELGTVIVGDQPTITIAITTTPEACGTVENTSHVTSVNESDTTNNDSNTVVITVECPDLDVDKTAGNATINAGDVASFTITVTNIGAGDAFDVDLDDILPDGGLDWSENPDNADCTITPDAGGDILHCDIGTLAGTTSGSGTGGSFSVTVEATTDALDCGTLENTASATASNEPGDALLNNSATATITVECPDLKVTKEPDAGDPGSEINAGDTASFTITVENIGAGDAYDVELNDVLPNGGLDWSEDPDNADCTITPDAGGDILFCDIGTLLSGGSFSVTVEAVTDAEDCKTLLNTASAEASNEPGDVLANNIDTGSITVLCPDVGIVKTAIANNGDCKFEIVVTNEGDGDATNVVMTDTLPVACDETVVFPDGADCTVVGQLLTCNFGTLASGETRTVTVEEACPDIDNTANVTADGDTNAANNSSSDTDIVDCHP